MSRFPKLNSEILLGFLWTLIATNYVVFRFIHISDIRLIDWIASGAMFSMGLLSIAEGLKVAKNNASQNIETDRSNS